MQRPSLPVKVVGDFLLSLNTLAVGGARFSDAKVNGCRRMASYSLPADRNLPFPFGERVFRTVGNVI